MLKKIECIVRPSRIDRVQKKLKKEGVPGMTVSKVRGYGRKSELNEHDEVTLEERSKIEIVVQEHEVDNVIDELKTLAGRGEMGAGKIFVLPVEDAVRISTEEHGRSALQ